MALPQALIIGTVKGGTTSLYAYLMAHPLVRASRSKESGFFTGLYQRGIAWYAEQFPELAAGQVAVDATPEYLRYPHACARVRQHLPRAKLIVMLRDPVERAGEPKIQAFTRAIRKTSRSCRYFRENDRFGVRADSLEKRDFFADRGGGRSPR